MSPLPITLITGFLGSGKTTLLLSLLPDLQAENPSYKLALLKNEFGDVAIDSQLASSASISGVRELLNGCICCNLVGQVGPALEELARTIPGLDRVVIETSGSAFPATLAMEINRLSRETGGEYVLDGVVSVVDVENWKGYQDTSYTATLQARYTDIVVLNKWEDAGEGRLDECVDRLADLEGVLIAWVKSNRGKVAHEVLFGIDCSLAKTQIDNSRLFDGQGHAHEHQNEVEVLSITLHSQQPGAVVNIEKLENLLKTAPRDEVYRIKAVLTAAEPILGSDQDLVIKDMLSSTARYILNWAFGRWTCTPFRADISEHDSTDGIVLRMTMILAPCESTKWKKKMETAGFIGLDGGVDGSLKVERMINR